MASLGVGLCRKKRGALASCMKIILDESVPQKLRFLIDNRHVVITTWFQGSFGLKNRAFAGRG
jgi:hypothetical protein